MKEALARRKIENEIAKKRILDRLEAKREKVRQSLGRVCTTGIEGAFDEGIELLTLISIGEEDMSAGNQLAKEYEPKNAHHSLENAPDFLEQIIKAIGKREAERGL